MSEPSRVRKRKLNVYLLEEEWLILNIKSEEAGMSKSEYIRNMILFGYAHERTVFSKEEERKIRNELNRIGTNINQIAVRANTNKSVNNDDFKNLNEQYLDLLDSYQDIMKGIINGNNENTPD